MRRFHCASFSFSIGPLPGEAMPALLTSASRRPKRCSTCRTQARTAASREMSQRMNLMALSVPALTSATATR